MSSDEPWGRFDGRDLEALPSPAWEWNRVVALLNVWDDRPELERSLDTWYPHVDLVLAADGAYPDVPEVGGTLSTDGTRELLQEREKVVLLDAPIPQIEKRSLLVDGDGLTRAGDLLWLIDADELYAGAHRIRSAPYLDVGWIRYGAPIYRRDQDIPRVIRWRPGLHYRGRHHWVFDGDGQLVKTNQLGGQGLVHRLLPIRFENTRGDRRPRARKWRAQVHRGRQAVQEGRRTPGAPTSGWEPLRILNLAPIDPGAAVHRFHAAVNLTTPHESIYGLWRRDWIRPPFQYHGAADAGALMDASRGADVFHFHRDPRVGARWGIGTPRRQVVVFHHHGTPFRRKPGYFNRLRADLRLVSNLELLQYGPDLHYLPNPVPVGTYQLLARGKPAWDDRPFRIGHSPTWRGRKGTDELLEVVGALRGRGYEIELELIEKVPLRESLEAKARCHAFFDSFWLGIQCSGLEAAAMGLPTIAGDPDVRRGFEEWRGEAPYVFAGDQGELEARLVDLLDRRGYYYRAASTVFEYVRGHHDYPAVAARYLDLLDDAVGWRERMSVTRFQGGL